MKTCRMKMCIRDSSIAILPCPAAKEPGDTTGAIANEKEVTGVA